MAVLEHLEHLQHLECEEHLEALHSDLHSESCHGCVVYQLVAGPNSSKLSGG